MKTKKIKEFFGIFFVTFVCSLFITLFTIDHEYKTERKNIVKGCNKYGESSLIVECLKKVTVGYKDYEKRYLVSMFYQASLMTLGVYLGRTWDRKK